MHSPFIRNSLRALRDFFSFNDPDRFLRDVRGVIHVGANTGSEREHYHRRNLDVVWIEPIPSVYNTLVSNLRPFPRQKALLGLITDCDGKSYTFNVSSNAAASSSIFKLSDHKVLWPEVRYVESIPMESKTLPTILQDNNIDIRHYDALVLDTQGSELLVLKGAQNILSQFQYIKTEAADFESYQGCCKADEIGSFLATMGFEEIQRTLFHTHKGSRNYYDLVYRRKDVIHK